MSPERILIQPVTAVSLTSLRAACYPHVALADYTAFAHQVLEWQAYGRAVWLVASHDQSIIGNGQLLIYPSGAELANLHVVAEWRGQGVGSWLIERLEAEAQRLAVTAVEISVDPSNGRAAQLYQRLGYRPERTIMTPSGQSVSVLRKGLGTRFET